MPESSSTSQPVCLRGTRTAILSRLKCVTRVETRFSLSSSLGCMLHPYTSPKKKKKLLQGFTQDSGSPNICLWKSDMHVCAPLIPHFSSISLSVRNLLKNVPTSHIRCISQSIASTLLHRAIVFPNFRFGIMNNFGCYNITSVLCKFLSFFLSGWHEPIITCRTNESYQWHTLWL